MAGFLVVAGLIWTTVNAVAQKVTVDATPSHVANTFSPPHALGAAIDRLRTGTPDKLLSDPLLKEILGAGWQTVTYRQNTELMVEAWHWNPRGAWSNVEKQEGYFVGSANPTDEMIHHSWAYPLPHRGFSRGDGNGWSRLTDGDPTQLHQVLLNLAVNARDAMPNGGLLMLVAANFRCDVQCARENPEARTGPYVLVKATDTGAGIPPEIRDRIFEPFFTTKELGKGTGLGLATAYAIVKSHGGFVTVASEIGHGTTFNIHLPANPDLQAGPPEPAPVGVERGLGEVILVVDDESSIRSVTQLSLEKFGYRVVTAGNGAEACAFFAQHWNEVALVLTDMMMPVMDGPATISAILRINPCARIIGVSGIHFGESTAKAASLGVRDFLPKPYTIEEMLKKIREVLDRPEQP